MGIRMALTTDNKLREIKKNVGPNPINLTTKMK